MELNSTEIIKLAEDDFNAMHDKYIDIVDRHAKGETETMIWRIAYNAFLNGFFKCYSVNKENLDEIISNVVDLYECWRARRKPEDMELTPFEFVKKYFNDPYGYKN